MQIRFNFNYHQLCNLYKGARCTDVGPYHLYFFSHLFAIVSLKMMMMMMMIMIWWYDDNDDDDDDGDDDDDDDDGDDDDDNDDDDDDVDDDCFPPITWNKSQNWNPLF